MYGYLLRGGVVVDGSGDPPKQADVAVQGNRIAAVAPCISSPAVRVVDAEGLVVAPGFIDIHGHSDMTLFRWPFLESKIFQGVTTEVTGNCGLSLVPAAAGGESELADYLRLHDFFLPEEGINWRSFADYADCIDSFGLGLNVAPLVGHAALRIATIGMENRIPVPSELALMKQLLAEALRQGAWGMSTGLIYPPGSFSDLHELVALAGTVAEYDALYTTHMRNEGNGVMAALDEAAMIGRESGARVQVSHLKAMGRSNWGKGREILEKVAAARSAGVDIAADQYPYDASATSLSAVIPQWAHAGGPEALLKRLSDPCLRERLISEIDREMAAREGAEGIMISNCRSERNRNLSGQTVARIAEEWGCLPAEAVMRLMVEERGAVGAIFFSMKEEDVETIMADPLVAVGSDGHGLSADEAKGEATHPRSYGCFPRVLGRFVREKKVLSLPSAIYKMSRLPAERLGLTDRGLLRAGFAADLVVFDQANIRDTADYVTSHSYAGGIVHLLVNGRPVIEHGRLTGHKPGRVLRRRAEG